MTMISTLYSLPRIAGRRIGLFGGSFNPAHAGHLAVSEEALKRLQLDEVWWLVSPQNPLKDSADTADFERRVAHARKLAAHPRMRVTGLEARLGTRTTAQTFAALQPMFELGHFVWIMGADSFAGLHHWNDWREIPATLAAGRVRTARLVAQGARFASSSCDATLPDRRQRCCGAGHLQAPAWAFPEHAVAP
jgi:nicotinate-nucleotide adenylyltransferase